jgi:Raf kinase inhibitor-like YbhB/YbcL family protein
MRHAFSAACLIALLPAAAGAQTLRAQTLRSTGTPTDLPKIHITSTTFAAGARQPRSVAFAACGGDNISPQLSWSGAPAGTKSFALTEFDRDAPTGVGFWHWLVVNIPPSVTSLPAGAALPAGAVAGMTDHGLPGYQGPCPPVGDYPHHYTFTISALNVASLPVNADTTGPAVQMALRGHVIAQGTYVGIYAR